VEVHASTLSRLKQGFESLGAPVFHSQTRKTADSLAFSPTGDTRKGYNVHQRSWFSHMLYASRRRSIWRYRRAVPEALRAVAGRREYIVSLDTRDDVVAAQRHARVHLDAERQFKRWRDQAAGAPVHDSAQDEWMQGQRFLRGSGFNYIPLEQLRAEHDASGLVEQPSEFERRLGFVADRLGIITDDVETRDEAINGSLEARAVLGALQRPMLRLSGALQIYLDEKAADLSRMTARSARGFRLERERVIAGLRDALGEDKPVETLTRSDARLFRDHLVTRQVAASTVNKYLRIARTIVGTAIRDHDLSIRNPFESLRVEDETPDIERRHPLSPEEIKLLLAARDRINGEL
jgi:hypothetical protein